MMIMMTSVQKKLLSSIDSSIEAGIQKPATFAEAAEFLSEIEALIEATREALADDKKREEGR